MDELRALRAVDDIGRDGPRTVSIQVLGKQIVDGVPVRSTRPLEFVIALAAAGGERHAGLLRTTLFDDWAGRSAVANLAYRARGLGVGIDFDRFRESYRLTDRVTVDVLALIHALREGDHELAMWLYEGPCLPSSRSPIAHRLRDVVARRVREALATVPAADEDRFRRRFADLLGADDLLALAR